MKRENIILMYGENTFSIRSELNRWRKAFAEKYGGDMNLEEFDGDKLNLGTFGSAVMAMPFLSEKRLVILKNFLSANKADAQKELIPIIEKVPDSTILVIMESLPPDKRTALYKNLLKIATVKLFAKPQGAQLNTWIIQRIKIHQGVMDQKTASYLVSLIGADLFRLENEAQKLALYAGEKPITIEMIDELVSASAEKSIFAMTDQMARKDIKGALRTLKELQDQGHEAPYLFAMIARQFRLMMEIKALSEQRMAPNVIASKMKVHPFVVKNTLSQCRNFTYGQLRSGLEKLLVIDRRLKHGRLHLRQNEAEQYMLALERILIGN